MSERTRIAILAALATIVYGNSLFNGFTMDDRLYIFINPAVTSPTLHKLVSPNEATAVWRPLTFSSFALNLAAAGERSFLYHFVNLLLHVAVTLLLYFVLRKLLEKNSRGGTLSWVAALLFAVHPIHVEAVASVVGRAELLAAAFVLAAWLLHLHNRPILATISFALALMSKESALCLPLLIFAGDFAHDERKPFRNYAGIVLLAAAYVPLLWLVQGHRFGPVAYDFIVNPLAALPAHLRILNAIRIAWHYVGLLFYPATLSCDYSYNAIPLYAAWRHFIPSLLATFLALALWVWALWTKRRPWFLAGSMYLAAFAITGNILMAAGPPMGERIAYLPSTGFCLFVALLWNLLDERLPKVAPIVLLIVLGALATRTWVRNRDWQNNATLFFAGVRAVPGSVKMQDAALAQMAAIGDWETARTRAQLLLQDYPPFPEDLKTRGISEYDYRVVKDAERHWKAGETDDAMKFLDFVIERSPNFAMAWSDRSALRLQLGDKRGASSDALKALSLDANDSQAQETLDALGGRTN